MTLRLRAALLPLVSLLAACAQQPLPRPSTSVPVPPAPPPPAAAPAETAVSAGVRPGPALAALPGWREGAVAALNAFRISCPSLLKRTDRSGLTRKEDWQPACTAAAQAQDAAAFFEQNFETAVVGSGDAFLTGYYEPEINGARTARPGYGVPIYARPADLIDVDLGQFSDTLKGKKIRGRVEKQELVPYFERAEIDDGALAGKGLEIAWAADPIEFFFLQIQGSGRLKLPDGQIMRIGYASQNGRDYVAIGRVLKDRGVLKPGQATMDGIISWLRANPEEGRALMRQNKSYVFFRELKGAGPLGAMEVPLTPGGSVAADPAFVPLGAPLWLGNGPAGLERIWVAQDTGGAIKGANRFDTFWGAGSEARQVAGGMSAKARAVLLLPRGTVTRIGAVAGGTDAAAAGR